MRDKLKAKQQFLKDLQTDADYQRHKQNAIIKEEKFYNHCGETTIFHGTFRVSHVDNDIYNSEHIFSL